MEQRPVAGHAPRVLQQIALLATVTVCTLTFVATCLGILGSLLAKDAAGTGDFIEYWAAGHQLLHHSNPYDDDAILPIERVAGYPLDMPAFIMANPPTALPLVAPLGVLGPKAGEFVWLALSIACLIASIKMIRAMHGDPDNRVHWLGYSFAPAFSCLLAGQVTIFVLFGLVLFLRLHRTSPFLAGLSLWFCLLKPHLFLPFGIVLLTWIVITRSYRVLAGGLSAIAIGTAIALLLDPSAWSHYFQMMSSRRPDLVWIPCVSMALRQRSGHGWVQYLPMTIGCIWALAYFRKHRARWDWVEHGSLLMLVSVLVAPYTWLMDQAILIPALLHGAYATKSWQHITVLALASAAIEAAALAGVPLLQSSFFLWTAPAWLAWYVWATANRNERKVYAPPPLENGAGMTIVNGSVRDDRHEAPPVMTPFRRNPARPFAVLPHHRPGVLPPGSP